MATSFDSNRVDNSGFMILTMSEMSKLKTTVVKLLKEITQDNAQEVTIISGEPIFFKSNGVLEQKLTLPIWDDDVFNYFLEYTVQERLRTQRDSELHKNEINTRFFDTYIEENNFSHDFAVSLKDITLRIHAVSIYNASGVNKQKYCFTIRCVPLQVPEYNSLHLPAVFEKTTQLQSGLVLVCGHTGSGKTTTIASLVNSINKNPSIRKSILTIEDPIEFPYQSLQAVIIQRALNLNTASYSQATKDALRENVDIVVIGELRDAEAMDNAIRLAETGKLVFATLHCNSVEDSIDRIVDEFSGDLRESIRSRLAEIVVGILHQKLEVIKITDVVNGVKEVKEIQVPSVAGLVAQNVNSRADLRSNFTRGGLSKVLKEKPFAFNYDKTYKELVENKIVPDTDENKSKLVPIK